VNTSRGKLIDTTALIAGLKSGQIGGVAMDVYEEEEGIFFHDLSGQILQDDELAHLLIYPNVLITAHQAFLTHEALTQIAVSTTANIIAYGNSEPFLTGTQIA
jgi:D-lactate dehydrogenase